jgi:hypothetical protein
LPGVAVSQLSARNRALLQGMLQLDALEKANVFFIEAEFANMDRERCG